MGKKITEILGKEFRGVAIDEWQQEVVANTLSVLAEDYNAMGRELGRDPFEMWQEALKEMMFQVYSETHTPDEIREEVTAELGREKKYHSPSVPDHPRNG